MKKENYLPFDIETALAHPERVVTRDGRKVSEIYHFKNKRLSDYKVYACVGDEVLTYTIEGLAIKGDTRERDLFLLPEVKECFVNVYYQDDGDITIGSPRKTKADCLNQPGYSSIGFIKTIRITNEPE